MNDSDFWEAEDRVESFAAREPDHRLLSLIEHHPDPSILRVLDIGCAGGRNTEPLASLGFDFFAIDSSQAMVNRTRSRIALILGEEEANHRVQHARMEDLSRFASGDFHLVVALGVFHSASTSEQWTSSLNEAVRVLIAGGLLLVSVFSPRTDLTGDGITPVPGERHLYDGLTTERHYLVEADVMDEEMIKRGLEPAEPTDTVIVPLDTGRRVTVNGLYRKPQGQKKQAIWPPTFKK
jgi:SAM-dependent methyltransferase